MGRCRPGDEKTPERDDQSNQKSESNARPDLNRPDDRGPGFGQGGRGLGLGRGRGHRFGPDSGGGRGFGRGPGRGRARG
jgi:hypothetical protein